MVDVPTVSIAVASASVTIAAIYYVWQVRHQTKMRKADLIMRLHSQANSKEFVEAYQKVLSIQFNDNEDFVKKFGPLYSEGPVQTAVIMLAFFMEGLGVLLNEKLADIGALDKLFPIQAGWRKLAPVLIETRKQTGSSMWQWFEYLYNELEKRQNRGA